MSERERKTAEFFVSEQDKQDITSLVDKIDEATPFYERMPVISYDELRLFLYENEIRLVDRVSTIDPRRYGFKGPKLRIEPEPETLLRVDSQPYMYQGETKYTDVQFVPEVPFRAYQAMAEAMYSQLGRRLLIESSYRSSSYQAIVFLFTLRLNQFDVAKTASRVAIPGYSEHGTPSQLAFDFQNVDGLPSDETPQDFEGTLEYNWLVANAADFDFVMSYPKNNRQGIMFEPWHWRHMPDDLGPASMT